MTVFESLREMLDMAVALKRPAAEVAELRRQLYAYGPQDVAAVKAKQDDFLKEHGRG